MLRCASLYTYEIDDHEVALNEIKTQLAEKITLLEHTVGIIMCHPEFIASGVLKYLSGNLPFELVGATSSAQAVNGETGELILTLFIMTADDVRFVTGVTDDLTSGISGPVNEAYGKAAAGESGMPGLALLFPPLMLDYAGDAYVEAWKQIIPDTPIFGTIAVEDTIPFDDSETIYNGESYKTAITFVLCYGNINPRFLIGTLHMDKAVPYKGEITKSSGHFVQEINNVNAYEYFKDIGFASDGKLKENFGFVLYVIDQKTREDYDGVPVVRGLVFFTEDGAAIFRGAMDEGSTFSMLTSDHEDVLSTTREKVEQLNELSDINGVLLFPCIIRRLVTLRIGPLTELETIRDTIRPDIPFMAGYAGGEICPTSIKDGKPTNRFHNYSMIILVV
jgi:hypothetical protein